MGLLFKTQKLEIILTQRICCFPQRAGERSLTPCASEGARSSLTKGILLQCVSNNPGAANSSCMVGFESWQGAFLIFQGGTLIFTHGAMQWLLHTQPQEPWNSILYHVRDIKKKIKKSNTFNLTILFGCRQLCPLLFSSEMIHCRGWPRVGYTPEHPKLQQILPWNSNPPYFGVFFKFFLQNSASFPLIEKMESGILSIHLIFIKSVKWWTGRYQNAWPVDLFWFNFMKFYEIITLRYCSALWSSRLQWRHTNNWGLK